jgi:hypothetical protein
MRCVWALRGRFRSPLVVIALAACPGATRIDPARFAARPEWTPTSYALAPGRLPTVDAAAEISRDDAIVDVAYLDHVLEAAWPDATNAIGLILRDRARDAPLMAHTRRALCDELGRQYYTAPIHFAIGGQPCLGRRALSTPEPLVEVPSDRNYGLRIDRVPASADAADTEVAVLAIARFADPSDPGWGGFGDVLRELATRDLVVLDLQAARGDDPRMGFAVLAALGRQDLANLGWRAPATKDGPYARVARANLAVHGPSPRPPRSRAVWTSFGDPRELAAIAQTLSAPVRDRDHPLAMLSVIVGDGCESACGLVAEVAHLASGASPMASVDVVGAATPGLRGDEYGLVRLPGSGIDVMFPTATYGPTIVGESLGGAAPPPGFTRQILAGMHRIAAQRGQERSWSAQPLPECRTLTPDPVASGRKIVGCAPQGEYDGHPPPTSSLLVNIALDEVHARTFLASCPELVVGTLIHSALHGTIASLTTSAATLERLAAAPFVRQLEWECPMGIERSSAPATGHDRD